MAVSLVLMGRSSQHELLLPLTLTEQFATATLPAGSLTLFGGDAVDLWIDAVDTDGTVLHERLGVSPDVPVESLDATSAPGATWYGTVNGNLSVRVTSRAGAQAPSTPQVQGLEEAGGATQLVLTDIADPAGHPSSHGSDSPGDDLARSGDDGGGVPEPVLVLVGRKSRLEVQVALVERPPGWSAMVGEDELGVFGVETVDIYVTGPAAGGGQSRRRVSVGPTTVASEPGAVRRWHTTAEGNLSVRRQTPVEAIVAAGAFDEEFYREQVPNLPDGIDPIEHYVSKGATAGLNPSAMFDSLYYKRMNPIIRRRNPLAHYCEFGWRELRNPSPRFNTWWYWSKHLDPADDSVNPLAHYERAGKHEGLSTQPDPLPSRLLRRGHRFTSGAPVRRVCLFAAYDADGVVDDYVVDYVRELSRHADVYYLADSVMQDSELAKLAEFTRGAWGIRHGEYDWGSYARLVQMVGWSVIEEYDELLLVNDSCYLLRPLDAVFARMDARACDWWGLQATKGIYATRNVPVNQFREPIPMESVRSTMIDGFEQDYSYDFLIGSFFLAYRKPVIVDPEFRRYLASVVAHESKRDIIMKYEIGLTHWLIQHGHSFDTFVSCLYPFHPVYSKWYFRLLDEGFPLLKRFFLTENHYRVPRLSDWPELIKEHAPTADIAAFQRNLDRVTDPDKLYRSLHIGESSAPDDAAVAEELMTVEEFVAADAMSPKHADWWAFPVDEYSGVFAGNERAVFEEVKDDPSVHKIVLTRDRDVTVDGVNVEVVPLESPMGQHRLMRAGTILIKQNRDSSVRYPVAAELHNLIQVWHGVPYKRIGFASADFQGMLDRIAVHHTRYRAVISSSKVDSLAMTAAFYPLTFHQIWNTGLPRNDFIVRSEDQLPDELLADLQRLRGLVADRRLVLFLPTFRNAQSEGYYRFSPEEIRWLDGWLRDNDCVLGVREHMADTARLYSSQLTGLPILDLSDAVFSHVEVLYRVAAALITDYSSSYIDFLLTGRPVVSFAYDYESYQLERGGFYDLDLVFPGPICKSFSDLQVALGQLWRPALSPSYEFVRRLFFDHVDDHNSARLVEKIRGLVDRGLGTWSGERVA